MRIRIRKYWLTALFDGLTRQLLGMSLITLYFYLVGNAQGFTDKTLILLFNIESWILSLTVIASTLTTMAHFAMLPFSRKPKIGSIVFSILVAGLSFVLFLAISLLQAFLDGYAG